MKNVRLFLVLFLFTIFCFSQNIDLIRFNNNVIYTPGSGVSVHINPTGVFNLEDISDLESPNNNSFILELSDLGGGFNNPVILATVNDFYTPLINGVIPSNTLTGSYKLRIRSTQPNLSLETEFFTIDGSTEAGIASLPTVQTSMISNTNYFECLNDGENIVNPSFGTLKQSYDAIAGDMPSSYKFFQVTPSDLSYSMDVKLIDIGTGTTTAITAISSGVFTIPDNLPIGTYNFEVEEIDHDGFSSIFSFTFLYHTSATIFGNASSEIVCVGENVIFSVDITELGILGNYMASYYIFDFGDGTPILTLTQAELLEMYTDPVTPITHVFNQPSCSSGG